MEGLGDGPARGRGKQGMSQLEQLTLAPWAKWRRYGLVPWKLLLQLALTVLVSTGVVLRAATFGDYSRSVGRTWAALFFPEGYEDFQSDFQTGAEYHIFRVNDTLEHAQKLVRAYYELPTVSVDDVEVWEAPGQAPIDGTGVARRSAAEAKGVADEDVMAKLGEPHLRVSYNDGAPTEVFWLHNTSAGWPLAATSPLAQAAAGPVSPEDNAFISEFFARLERYVFRFQVRSYGWNDGAAGAADVCLVWNVHFFYDFTVGGQVHVRNAYGADRRCEPLEPTDSWYIFNGCLFAVAAILLLLILKSAADYLGILFQLRRVHGEVTKPSPAAPARTSSSSRCGSQGPQGCLSRICSGNFWRGRHRGSEGHPDESRPLLEHEGLTTRESLPPASPSEGAGRHQRAASLEERTTVLSTYHRLRSGSDLCSLGEDALEPQPLDENAMTKLRRLVFGHETDNADRGSTGTQRTAGSPWPSGDVLHATSPRGLVGSDLSGSPVSGLGMLASTGHQAASFLADIWLLLCNWLLLTTAGCVAALIFSGEVLLQHADDDAVGGADMQVSLGLAALGLWFGLAQFLEYVPQYYVLVQTLKRAAPRVGALLLGALPLFVGYMLLGMVLFGDQLDEFGSLGATFTLLFSCLNGDALLDEYKRLDFFPYVGTLYLTCFILLFTYVLLMSLIAVVEEAFFTAELSLRRLRGHAAALPPPPPPTRHSSTHGNSAGAGAPFATIDELTQGSASGRSLPRRLQALLSAASTDEEVKAGSPPPPIAGSRRFDLAPSPQGPRGTYSLPRLDSGEEAHRHSFSGEAGGHEALHRLEEELLSRMMNKVKMPEQRRFEEDVRQLIRDAARSMDRRTAESDGGDG